MFQAFYLQFKGEISLLRRYPADRFHFRIRGICASPVRRNRTVYSLPLAACVLITATRLYCCSEATTTGSSLTGVTLLLVRNLFFTSIRTESGSLPCPHCQGIWRKSRTVTFHHWVVSYYKKSQLMWAQYETLRDTIFHILCFKG